MSPIGRDAEEGAAILAEKCGSRSVRPAAPEPSKADQAYFGRFTGGYAPYADRDLDRMIGPLLEHAKGYTRLRVLEVGCASGQFSTELFRGLGRTDALFSGLDIAAPVLKQFPFAGVCGSAFQSPFSSGSFEVICFPASLHHLFPLDAALDEMARVLAPGGLMYCVEPNYYHPHRRFFMRFQALYRLCRDMNDVPIRHDWLGAALERRGFKVLHLEFVNLQFQNPGLLQKAQNAVASIPLLRCGDRWRMPWFVTLARKGARP